MGFLLVYSSRRYARFPCARWRFTTIVAPDLASQGGYEKMDQALEAFGQQARSWSPFFVARARVVLAMREDDGWHLWYSYTAYLRELPTTFEKCDVRTENVRAFREVVPFGDAVNAERTITELLQHPGRIDVDGSNLELGPTTQHLRFEYEPLHLSRFAGPSRLPALTA